MGKMVEKTASERGHTIVPSLESASVCIDFSHPDAVLQHVEQCAREQKALVMGTTGWEAHYPAVKKRVEESGIAFLHSPNFSIGVLLFRKLLKQAGALIAPFPEYEAAGVEWHHSQKVDNPSGTAKVLSQIMAETAGRPCPFTGIRCGSVPGTHTVIMDGPFDMLELTHRAKGREGFALGAVTAAEWLVGRKGIFTIEDLL